MGASLLFAVSGASAGCQSPSLAASAGYQGVVELEETALAFEAGGRLSRLAIKEGDVVPAGAEVAALEDDVLRTTAASRSKEAEAASAQSALIAAQARPEDLGVLEARVRAAQANEDNLARSLARQRALVSHGAAPAATVDDLDAAWARAKAERESLQWQLAGLRKGARSQERESARARASAALAAASVESERLKKQVLRAPLAGRILDVHAHLGEVVLPGVPIASMADATRPYVDIFVPQAALGPFAVGGAVRVRADTGPELWHGRVENISRKAEFTPRYLFSEKERAHLVIRVRVRIDDPKETLHAGLPVSAELGP